MAKQLNVDLNFSANTSQAKQQILELQTALSKITTSGSIGVDSTKMKEASAAAKELSIHLNNAFNAQTGKLDLSKLDKSLKTSSTNVTELSNKLLSAGNQGQQAFIKLAQTISAADRPVVTLGTKLNGLFTTLKNTARWQLSSSVLHGFMGAYQQAMGYVKDLNKSLTDIRIVTGKSIDDMSRFAIEANKAAKALSTTTNEYAQASLIFFQQGLNEEEVAKRAAVTTKLANVTGQTTQVVSDQLTAVWNNFYDGSKSLEYYADVLTALGAATASSTDEIAGGLEKFAAIGDTIGLSYEYAASALATITANTRQSEEVVGTALKTIFARIQGLNLGETLDDGVTLNKYSEALQKVGISIFDQAGELKDMDDILDEMGAKWETLNKAQQTALAQTVAGTRQYTQLVALMDNWDAGDSDSMKANLDTAYGAEGELQNQADIYAESWEAARDRVKASLETIYNQLLDDEFFIDISNGFSHLLDSVSAFIDGIGGVKTILGTVFAFFLSSVSTKIEPALQQLRQNFEIIFTGSSKSAKKMAEEMQAVSMNAIQNPKNKFSDSDRFALESSTKMSVARNKMFDVEKDLSPLEKQQYEIELQILEVEQKNIAALIEQNAKKKESIALAEKEVQLAKEKLAEATQTFDEGKAVDIAGSDRESEEAALRKQFDKAKANYQQTGSGENLAALNEAKKALFEHMDATEQARNSFERFIGTAKQAYEAEMELTNGNIQASESAVAVGDIFSDYAADLSNLSTSLTSGNVGLKETKAQLNDLESQLNMATGGVLDFSEEFANMQTAANGKQLAGQIDKLIEKLKESKIPAKDLEKILNDLGQGKYTKALSNGYKDVAKKTQEAAKATKDYEQSLKRLRKAQNELNKKFDAFNPEHKAKALESFAKAGAGLGKVASSITMIRSAAVALNNEDLTFGEKLTTVTMSLTMALPMLSSGLANLRTGFSGLNSVFGMTTAVQKLAGMTMLQNASYTDLLTGKITAQQVAQRTGLSLDQAEVLINQAKAKQMLQEAAAHGALGGAKMKEIVAERLGCTTKQAGIIVSKMKAGASFEEAAAEAGVTLVKSKGIVASIANTAAKLGEAISTKMKTVADKGETAGIWAKVAAYIAEQAAAWPVLVVTLLIVAAIAALAAIVVLLVKGIQALVAAYNADEIAAEKAATAAKNLGEAYNECKQEYEDMIAAMENYKSARDALDNLTKGTQEYKEALKEANRQAMELINQYGLIEGQDYEWQGDELVIKDEAMDRVAREKEAEVDKTYAASQMANAEAKRTRAVADQTALRREMRDEAGVGDGDQVWKGILTHAVGAAFGPLGTMVANGINASRAAKGNAYDEAINKAIEEGQTNAKLWTNKETLAKELNINDKDLIDALWENKESIQQLSADMNAASEYEKLAAQNAANELMDGKGYENTEAGKMAMEAGGEIYQQMYNDAYDKYATGKKTSKDDFERYAEEAGLTDLKGFKMGKRKGDGSVEYTYLDEQGQEQKATATQEEIAAMLAAADAASGLEGALSQLRGTISDLNNSADLGDHAMAEFLSTGNMEGATKEEFDDIRADAGVTGAKDKDGNLIYDKNAVNSMLGLTGDTAKDDELAKSRGYESAEAYRKAFVEAMDVEWEVPKGLDKQIADKLTVGAMSSINSTYEKMGEEGGEAFLSTLESVASGADWEALAPEDQTAMINELANIDWTSWDAGEQAIAIAERYGVAIDATSEAWQKNINAMRDASNALPDLQAMREEFEKIQEITADIDLGSILTEEDYNTLVKYNSELSKYFAILSDGSAQFIGDKLDFQQQIKETHQKELQDAMAEYQDRYNEIQDQIQRGADAVGGVDKLDSYRDTENYVGDDGNNYYSGVNVDKQLDFLESQGYDQAKLDEWRLELEDGLTTVQVLDDIASAVNTTADAYNALGTEAEDMKSLIQGSMNEIALSADSAKERMQLLQEGTINEEAYNYAAMAAHNAEKWEDIDPGEVEDYADSLMEVAEASELVSDELKDNKEAAEDVALYTKKMNKGIDALADGFEDWSDILKKSDSSSEEFAEAMAGMKSAMSDVLGVGEEWLSNDFILSNLEDIEKAANGDADAINRLAIAAGKDILVHMELEDEGVREQLYALHDELAAEIPNIEVGATLDDGDFLSKAAQVVETANMTVDEANAYFRALGFEPHFETKEEKVTTMKPKTRTHTDYALSSSSVGFDLGPFGKGSFSIPTFDAITTSWNEGYTPIEETVQIPALTTDGGEPNFSLTRTNSGAMNNYSGKNSGGGKPGGGGGGGGGGGSKPKATSEARMKKSEIVDPYKEVNDQIERTNHLMTKNNTLAEGMWGAARSAKMRENIGLLNQEVALLGEKLDIAKEQVNLSRGDLSSAAAVLGLQLEFDGDGLVTNIVDVQESIWKQREALLDSFGADIDEAEQAQLDAFDEYMENFTSAYDEYENHRQTQMDAEAEQLAKQLEAQQIMFDDLNTTLEENISLIEQDLAVVEYYLSKVEDDFYGMAEAAALMVGSLSSANPGEGGQLGAYLDTLAAQKAYKEELDAAYANGDINQAQYIEGLMNCQDATMDALSSLNELDKTMVGYYGETLEAAQEELSKYTDMMEHHTEVLDHYLSLLDLIGASKDWARMKTVLQTQVEVAENSAAVSKANYEMLAQEAEQKKKAWEDAQNNSNLSDYEKSVIEQQWLDAQSAANEAQSKMLEDAAAWAESLKSLLETELAELAEILEESLAGEFGSLDNMMTAMERANSLQEEYLTTTNQVYETNKLMHTAQQEIDKTTNSVAKRRLKQYIDETEQLQNKNKLSQFELDIQKAKYDLLVAEIALEEAQQAKSTVRLQRDSEGNFGYVYTADQNAVDSAQQELEDAQNALYNIGLEGANKYAESYAQTVQEMNDAITELTEKWQNGEIASREEYEKEMLRLKEYYGEKLMQYSELHTIALSTDSRVAADAWTKDFAHMTTQTQQWMTNVDRYVQGVEASMGRYQAGIDRVEQFAGLDLISLKQKTEDIKKENDELAKSITKKDGVLDAIKAEITQVGDLALKYAALRKEIQGTVDDYEALLQRMGVDIDTAASGQPPLGGNTGGGNSGGDNTGGGNSGGDNTGGGNSGGDNTGGGNSGGGEIKAGGKVNAGSAQIYDYAGDTSGERQYFSSDPVYNVLEESGDWIKVRHHKLSSGVTGWFKKSDVTAMNTGGYTGDWSGSYGKLAFLHQKELVLNAQDTENLLASMDILDKIISTIDLYSSSAQLGGMLSSPRYGGFGETEALEQNVHIEASFPNVSDHNEIEEALNNLINRASQYAHRK